MTLYNQLIFKTMIVICHVVPYKYPHSGSGLHVQSHQVAMSRQLDRVSVSFLVSLICPPPLEASSKPLGLFVFDCFHILPPSPAVSTVPDQMLLCLVKSHMPMAHTSTGFEENRLDRLD
jgi:hypothetical protein